MCYLVGREEKRAESMGCERASEDVIPRMRDNVGGGAVYITLERMEQPSWSSLRAIWVSLPSEVRYAPATPSRIEAFESTHGQIPSEYRAFLLEFGGGVVGSEWVDGVEQLPNTHRKFLSETGPGGWSMRNVFVIGWDGAGNPLAIDQSGAVVVEDHNSGELQQLAPSFRAYLAKGLCHAL